MNKILKVFIVDDEKIIREGMVTGIEWESLGFKVSGQAEDGETAIEIIDKIKPDLVITDIKMPFIDGLQLVEILKEKHPNILTVIISGHDEFEYAQKAVKLGAYDYLLKPLDLQYLCQMLIEIKEFIFQKREMKSDSEELRLLKIFRKIWGAYQILEQDSNYLEKLWNSKLQDLIYCAAILSVDQTGCNREKEAAAEHQLLDYFIRELIENTNVDSNIEKSVLNLEGGKYGIILVGKDFECMKKDAGIFVAKIEDSFKKMLGMQTFISVSGIHRGVNGLGVAVKEAAKAFEFRYIAGNKKIVSFNNIKNKSGLESSYYDISGILKSIKLGDESLLSEELKMVLKAAVARREYAKGFIDFICAGLLSASIDIIQEYGGSIGEIFDDPVFEFDRLSSVTSINNAIDQLHLILNRIIDYLDKIKKTGITGKVEDARKYIDAEYTNKQISLQRVADHIHINLCYLSELFKKHTGQSYIEYLTGRRIGKARELLACTDFKSYEIADMIGYENATYFSTTFKKMTGISPMDYRKNTKKDVNDESQD